MPAFDVPANLGSRVPHALHVRGRAAVGAHVAQLLEMPTALSSTVEHRVDEDSESQNEEPIEHGVPCARRLRDQHHDKHEQRDLRRGGAQDPAGAGRGFVWDLVCEEGGFCELRVEGSGVLWAGFCWRKREWCGDVGWVLAGS